MADPAGRPAGAASRRVHAGTALVRLLLFAGLWSVLVEGERHGWAVPAITILAATAVSLALGPATGFSAIGLARFIPFFLLQSIRGGTDVARRAFLPSLPIRPGVHEYRCRLPDERQRAVLAGVIGLFPGTIGVRLVGDRLRIHALNRDLPVIESVREVERRLAAAFATDLPDDPG